jgi:hypothetical protein
MADEYQSSALLVEDLLKDSVFESALVLEWLASAH